MKVLLIIFVISLGPSQKVIVENGTDIIIVGRGVYEAADPAAAAQLYQTAGWAAYEQRLAAGQQ